MFVVVPLRLEKRSEWSLERWYLDRSALNSRLLISIFFLDDFGMGTISDITGREMRVNNQESEQEKPSLRELLHNPRFTTRRVMLTAVD